MSRLIKNGWYAAALSSSVGDGFWDGWIAGEPVLLYRRADGSLVALENRCPHRHAPLSLGYREGDNVRCGYHGFLYDDDGRCIELPGQAHIPATMCLRRFAVAERHGIVWIWPGPAALADPAALPDYPCSPETGFIQQTIEMEIGAPVWALIDNLLDLTHVAFLHSKIGRAHPIHEATMRTEVDGDCLIYTRELQRTPEIRQKHVMRYHAPGIVNALIIPYEIATGRQVIDIFGSNTLHCVTPLDEKRSRYVAVRSFDRRFADDPLAVPDLVEVTLNEDRVMAEAMMQVKQRSGAALPPERLIMADRAAVEARRLYQVILTRERPVESAA